MEKYSPKMFIYCLINPLNNKMFYIGQTKDPYSRLVGHIFESIKNKTSKDVIITSICKEWLLPKYEILEEIEVDINNKQSIFNVSKREKYWVDLYCKDLELSNVSLVSKENIRVSTTIGVPTREKKCLYCNVSFLYTSTKSRYCSNKCRVYYNRAVKGMQKIDKNEEEVKNISTFDKSKYDFGQDSFLNIEKYTKYPIKNCPSDFFNKKIYMTEKSTADLEIKEAWNKFKNNG